MKSKVLCLILLIVMGVNSINKAQAPNAFKYQAVIRNSAGKVLVEKDISVKINIVKDNVNGSLVYSETHSAETNKFGIVNLEIGKGTKESGDFSGIDWGIAAYFIQIEIDETGETNYRLIGTSQLLSVPYALYAEKAGNSPSLWENSGDTIYYNKGNVGIAVSNPTDRFQVGSNTNWNSYTLGLPGDIRLAGYSPATPYAIIGARDRSGTNSIGLILRTQNSGSIVNSLFIMSSGNVGIGVSQPARNLHVKDVLRLEPRTSAPTSPAKGDIYVNSVSNKLTFFNGSSWDDLTSGASLWLKQSDAIYTKENKVVIGNNIPYSTGLNDSCMLTIYNTNNDTLTYGSRNAIATQLNVNADNLKGIVNTYTGFTEAYNDHGAVIGHKIDVTIKKLNTTSSSIIACAKGGRFGLFCDNLTTDYPQYSCSLAGISAILGGTIITYSNNTKIGALVAEDKINSDSTFAGYFVGKGYFTDKVGIGTKTPARNLHVKDVLRLEPRSAAPGSPQEGDIYMDSTDHKLKVYDGTSWHSLW